MTFTHEAYPSKLELRGSLHGREVVLRPFTVDQVDAYAQFIESSTAPSESYLMPTFYAVYKGMEQKRRHGELSSRAQQLEQLWHGASRPLPLMAYVGGELIGFQHLQVGAQDELITSSFIGDRHRGRGFGTLIRATALAYAFHWQGFNHAVTNFVLPNCRSEAVSRKLGYRPMSYGSYPVNGLAFHRVGLQLAAKGFTPPVGLEVALHSH